MWSDNGGFEFSAFRVLLLHLCEYGNISFVVLVDFLIKTTFSG